jgi:alkanesulfonate monooxygenase SsuD/methylene tetrahydromethanopterin reductase-like flavin-dependent oxidoreductase (luciferase family)
MKAAWSGEGVHFAGRHFTARGHTALPRPIQQPHPPIWVGGNSRRAIRRAVELADGWMPIFNPAEHASRRRTPAIETADDVRARIAYARELGERVGRTAPLEVVITARGLAGFGTPAWERDRFVDDVGALHAAGVTYLAVNLPARSRAEHAERIARFGADVLPRLP